MKKIAIIGTGIMGSGMVMNFLKNGHEVFVWNRSKDKLQKFVDAGAVIVESPKVAAQKAEIIFEVTANDESSRSVWLQEDGILVGADPNKILIASATLSIPWVDELIKICAEKNLKVFDIPLTGGRIGAESGKLTLLVGGDENELEKIKPDLSSISENIKYFGKAGSGMRYKLVLNMMQGMHIVALGEGLKLAQSVGLDLKKAGDALAERPGGVITNIAWRDFQIEPDPINFSIEWITKDLSYAKKMAADLDMPVLDEVLKKYEEALDKGLGQEDWTAVNKL